MDATCLGVGIDLGLYKRQASGVYFRKDLFACRYGQVGSSRKKDAP
ncbi:hypothetical protein COMA2_80160 [Candidatus Nitrospira nitrificans]|uniref:Uncharacterized protein n=1 Tax=Candidatus Nitrospira nitrificans TaxID=1742973 RepID=A0A0S4LQE1_9BACT|nr:hypothetical protein COMA2_80160 [Candidatus Nitrospira nitrificans]